MPKHDIIVIGGSSGGIPALQSLLSWLPRRFPAAIFVVLHRSSETLHEEDVLPNVLTQRSDMRAELARDGQPIQAGHLYIAPRNIHLLVDDGVVRLESSPKETRARARPSIDVLFRSASVAYGKRVVAVLLSGLLDDGMAGLWQVRKRGGLTIVQEPAEAMYSSMPESALRNVSVDYCLTVQGIAEKLLELASRNVELTDGLKKSVRVLIVEDERLVALDLKGQLQDLGYEVVGSAASGETALDTALLVAPDIVLMDVNLSGTMRGTEAARLLWERMQIPSIFLTAYTDEQVLADAKLAKPFGYIVKPFAPEQVHAAIQMALDRYQREVKPLQGGSAVGG